MRGDGAPFGEDEQGERVTQAASASRTTSRVPLRDRNRRSLRKYIVKQRLSAYLFVCFSPVWTAPPPFWPPSLSFLSIFTCVTRQSPTICLPRPPMTRTRTLSRSPPQPRVTMKRSNSLLFCSERFFGLCRRCFHLVLSELHPILKSSRFCAGAGGGVAV